MANSKDISGAERDRNAHLIAAAPDMLAALCDVYEQLSDGDFAARYAASGQAVSDETFATIGAAIAKARGES